jgi:hypothetical protein
MTSANLELVRSILVAWEHGDFSSAEWAHPEIEYVHADGPEPGRWTGPAGMREAAREQLSAWEEFRPEVEEFRELDDEHILVLTHRRGRGKTSGLDLGEMRAKGAHLWHSGRSIAGRIPTCEPWTLDDLPGERVIVGREQVIAFFEEVWRYCQTGTSSRCAS